VLLLLFGSNLIFVFVKQHIKSESANTRSTVVAALKFAIVERAQPVDQSLAPEMSKFLELLKDKDLVGHFLNKGNLQNLTLLSERTKKYFVDPQLCRPQQAFTYSRYPSYLSPICVCRVKSQGTFFHLVF
jgi:hypothetical protein